MKKNGIDYQMWNVGILVITITSAHAGTLAKLALKEEKKFRVLPDFMTIYHKGGKTEQELALKTIVSLWGEAYVRKSVIYARLLSKKLNGEDFAITLMKLTAPTSKELNEPKDKLFPNLSMAFNEVTRKLPEALEN